MAARGSLFMRLVLLVLLATSCAFTTACSDRRGGGGGPPPPVGDGGGTDSGVTMRPDGSLPPGDMGCDKFDILFVIDDSGSMSEEQANLATNFPRFITELDAFRTVDGRPLDYRLGVTTTGRDTTTIIEFPPSFPVPPMSIVETGPAGELLMDSGCGMTRRWIERDDADVAGTFSCIAQVGTGGSSIEMPLHMLELSLTERVAEGTNAGFLREDALLAVVVLTDEDDCSRLDDPIHLMLPDITMPAAAADVCDPTAPEIEPLTRFLAAYDGVKGDRGRWAMAVIAGPGPGSCTSSFGDAIEASRLNEFLGLAGENTVFSSICEGDLATALTDALTTFDAACQSFPPLI